MTAADSRPELLSLHHVGIVVSNLDDAISHYERVLGARLELRKPLPDQRVHAASLLVGRDIVELITPSDSDSSIARFLQRRGEGLHHVAYGVADIDRALASLAAGGARLVDGEARPGLHGHRVAFVHPESVLGVLTELVELTS